MALILIIIIFIIVFAHKFYYYAALSPFQVPCSEDTNAHAQQIPRGSINEYT